MAGMSKAPAAASGFANIFDTELTTVEKIQKALIKLRLKSPFYSYLCSHLRFKESKQVETMGVTKKNLVLYNKDFVDKLSLPKLIGVTAHEAGHLALKHHLRQGHRTLMVSGNISLWNIACDVIDNFLLLSNGFELPEGAILPSTDGNCVVGNVKLKNIGDKSAEEIYEELRANLKNTHEPEPGDDGDGDDGEEGDGDGGGKDGQPGKGKGRGKGGNIPSGFDEHLWGKDQRDAGDEEGDGSGGEGGQDMPETNWDKVMAEAYNHAKMQGRAPAGMERQFSELHKSRVNWRALLRNVVSSMIPFDLSYRRPNKKYLAYDIFMPVFHGESVKVVVAFDTSGSMTNEEMAAGMSEVVGIARSFSQVEFVVLTHDTRVHDDLRVESRNISKLLTMVPHGDGGTDHRPLYEYIAKKNLRRQEFVLMISFTDGMSSFPERKPGIETIFVLTGNHVPREDMPKWARHVICLE